MVGANSVKSQVFPKMSIKVSQVMSSKLQSKTQKILRLLLWKKTPANIHIRT